MSNSSEGVLNAITEKSKSYSDTGIFDFTSNQCSRCSRSLSTSIYDLVLIYVCHFHHQYLRVTQFKHFSSFSLILSRYSCSHLGSHHPRIFMYKHLFIRVHHGEHRGNLKPKINSKELNLNGKV